MNQAEYPYETIYDAVAGAIIEQGLPKDGTLPASIFLAKLENGEVLYADAPPVGELINSPLGKKILNMIMGKLIEGMPEEVCLVLVTEAYSRSVKREEGETVEQMYDRLPRSLKNDPQAQEVVSIQLMRRGESRAGALLIGPERTLTYAPLNEGVTGASGKLIPEVAQAPKEKM